MSFIFSLLSSRLFFSPFRHLSSFVPQRNQLFRLKGKPLRRFSRDFLGNNRDSPLRRVDALHCRLVSTLRAGNSGQRLLNGFSKPDAPCLPSRVLPAQVSRRNVGPARRSRRYDEGRGRENCTNLAFNVYVHACVSVGESRSRCVASCKCDVSSPSPDNIFSSKVMSRYAAFFALRFGEEVCRDRNSVGVARDLAGVASARRRRYEVKENVQGFPEISPCRGFQRFHLDHRCSSNHAARLQSQLRRFLFVLVS